MRRFTTTLLACLFANLALADTLTTNDGSVINGKLGAITDSSVTITTPFAGDITVALTSTMIGIAVGLVGVVLILVALLRVKNREKWFFSWTVVLSVFWCLMIFPYGLIVGIPILGVFLAKRAEF